ncbi:MAG: glycosyltransferase family 4 protein [Candidatus Bathyarchaeia archaeon]
MKVCILAPEFLPVWGGVGAYIVELVRHMPSKVDLHIVTPFRERIGHSRVSSGDYNFSEHFGSNVHIHFISRAFDTFFYNASFQHAVAKYVPKLVKEEKIDLIHSHTAHMPDLLLSFRKLRVPVVTTIHTTIKGQRQGTKSSGMTFGELDLSEKMTFLAYPILRLIESFYLTKPRYYITVSQWMKCQLLKDYPKMVSRRIFVIRNAVDVQIFSPSANTADKWFEDKNVILFTGRLIAAKGINVVIDSISEIIKMHENAYFVFIGPGNPIPYIKRLKSKGVSNSYYRFLGYVKDRKDLVSYYRSASVYVAPTFYENLPIRILEAMACGVPVIATNVCAIPEVIENGVEGILIQPGSARALINAISMLLEDESLRKELGRNARKKVEKHFNWKDAAHKTLNIYEHVLSGER